MREFALLRTLGASRRQVLRSVLAEGLAARRPRLLVGLAARVRHALSACVALFNAAGVDLPRKLQQ